MDLYKFGAIDLGSNAIRLLIYQVFEYKDMVKYRKISYVRFPIRLGLDVFDTGEISLKKINQLIKTFESYKTLMELHEVDGYRACATSAMREAKNGEKVAQLISEHSGLNLEIISGEEEASNIYENNIAEKLDPNHDALYIDVGGGSTELSIFSKHKKVASKSFPIGTVRLLLDKVDRKVWDELIEFVENAKKEYELEYCIGTGGNINKISKVIKHKQYRGGSFAREDILKLQEKMEKMTIEQRIIKYGLKPDRADVIVHASEIFTSVMWRAGIEQIYIPKVGLGDGLIRKMYEKAKAGKDLQKI